MKFWCTIESDLGEVYCPIYIDQGFFRNKTNISSYFGMVADSIA